MDLNISNETRHRVDISMDTILDRVSEVQIYRFYYSLAVNNSRQGELKPGREFFSPFKTEKNPSFGLIQSERSKKLMFKCQSSGEGGDVVKFVSLITGIKNFNEILRRIDHDLGIGLSIMGAPTIKKSTEVFREHKSAVFDITVRAPGKQDLDFWKQFGAKPAILNRLVEPVSYFSYVSDGKLSRIITESENGLIYSYKYKDRNKLYIPSPERKCQKFYSNAYKTPFGLELATEMYEGNWFVFQTGGEKDVITLMSMGYPAICYNGENTPDYPFIMQNPMRKISLFDIDKTGLEAAETLEKATGCKKIILPHWKEGEKDISEMRKTLGEEKTISILEKALKEIAFEMGEFR